MSNAPGFVFRRVANLSLVAWGNDAWTNIEALQRQLDTTRAAYPSGSAVLNVIAVRNHATVREAWVRAGAGLG